MNTGKLNKRITYTGAGTYIDDGFGGKTQTVAGATTETWSGVRQLTAREVLSYGLPVTYRTFEFWFLYERGANISEGTIISYESKTFRVISVIEQDEAKRVIKVLAVNQ
jgi:head-tail adaptor